jgi:hypothetical protein
MINDAGERWEFPFHELLRRRRRVLDRLPRDGIDLADTTTLAGLDAISFIQAMIG